MHNSHNYEGSIFKKKYLPIQIDTFSFYIFIRITLLKTNVFYDVFII